LNVPFVDLKVQYQKIKSEIDTAVLSVMDNAYFILGENVAGFEKEFSDYLGGGYAVSVNSGLDALYLSLLACDIGPEDEVITVSHTFVATYLAVIHTGAKAVFVDIDPSSFNIDVNKIETHITKKTKAILPVHLYGQPADMLKIKEIAEKYNLLLIEDACQAHGAGLNNEKAGLLGDLACFSFYPAKNLGAYGDGGMVITKDEVYKKKLQQLRNYGQKKKYIHDNFGINSRLDELQAAILRVKLKHLDKWNTARRKIAERYSEGIKSKEIICPHEMPGCYHVYHLYVIRTPNRANLQKWLKEKGINTQIHYPIPVHLQQCYKQLSEDRPKLAVTEKIADEILSLPIYPEMQDNQIDYVIDSVNSFKH